MPDPRAWTRAGLDPRAYETLTRELTAPEVWSLLLDVMEQRARQRTPASLLEQWMRDAFTRPAAIDQRVLVALDGHLLAAAADFEAIELSPLAPLGSCSVVGPASQNKIVSALRGTEVVADPTNVLALECARRLRRDAGVTVHLATCHRCVRAQAVPPRSGFAQHFRIFCLASAAKEQPDHGFVIAALTRHIVTHLAALDRLEAHGYRFPDRRLRVLATDACAELGDRVATAVTGVPVTRIRLDHPYYSGGLRFMIDVGGGAGGDIPLIDGGAFDWVARLASNRKVVFVASGMGAQLVAHLFRRDEGQ